MPEPAEQITVSVNGTRVTVSDPTTVAAAIAQAGVTAFRDSVKHESRAPLCGMGICFECRVTINGQTNLRSCSIYCREGMEVRTDA